MRTAGAALTVIATSLLVGACGSGTAAEQAKNVASTAADKAQEVLAADTTTTETRTVTTPAKTVTEPAQTVTETRTVTGPGKTTSIQSNTTTVHVTPATTGADQSSSAIPWWGWALIALGAVAVVVATFMAGHARGARRTGPTPAAGRPPPGPPEDPI